jgi:hypothetical protein
MKYALSLIAFLALASLFGAFATDPVMAAPALDSSANAYLIPGATSVHGYVKPDDFD